jgi:hypothetical protein
VITAETDISQLGVHAGTDPLAAAVMWLSHVPDLLLCYMQPSLPICIEKQVSKSDPRLSNL